jgi:outer membrane protein TolC
MPNKRTLNRNAAAVACFVALVACPLLRAQDAQAIATSAISRVEPAAIHLSLEEAIKRAKALSPDLIAAIVNSRIAAENTTQARSALLPNVTGNTQYLYTEGNGTPSARFIANNGVHEYVAQADVHQSISGPLFSQYSKSAILEALTRDQAEIARRGLTVTVVQSYSAYMAAQGKTRTFEASLDTAQQFLKTTQELERGGEVAQADVLKASIQMSDVQVAYNDAQLAEEQARLALAVLVFPDVHQPFDLSQNPAETLTLPAFAEAEARAKKEDPEIDAAENAESAARKDLTAAWLGYLPSVSLDYFYGIDANQFAAQTVTRQGQPIQNLGYSAWASLSVPIFNWGATRSKVKQAEYSERQATAALDYTERKRIADVEQFYREAQAAKAEMEIRSNAAKAAEESRKLVLLQYRAGMTSALEVVNAEATVSTERNAYYDAETRYATAIATLATITGVL